MGNDVDEPNPKSMYKTTLRATTKRKLERTLHIYLIPLNAKKNHALGKDTISNLGIKSCSKEWHLEVHVDPCFDQYTNVAIG